MSAFVGSDGDTQITYIDIISFSERFFDDSNLIEGTDLLCVVQETGERVLFIVSFIRIKVVGNLTAFGVLCFIMTDCFVNFGQERHIFLKHLFLCAG